MSTPGACSETVLAPFPAVVQPHGLKNMYFGDILGPGAPKIPALHATLCHLTPGTCGPGGGGAPQKAHLHGPCHSKTIPIVSSSRTNPIKVVLGCCRPPRDHHTRECDHPARVRLGCQGVAKHEILTNRCSEKGARVLVRVPRVPKPPRKWFLTPKPRGQTN